MWAGLHRLTPEVGGAFKAAVEAEAQRIFRERRKNGEREPLEAYAAEALANLVLGKTTTQGVKYTVHILIDHAALVRGFLMDGEVCEIPGVGPVNVNWVRGLLGDAFLTAVVKKGKDIRTVAHLGRHVRAEVQTALWSAAANARSKAATCGVTSNAITGTTTRRVAQRLFGTWDGSARSTTT